MTRITQAIAIAIVALTAFGNGQASAQSSASGGSLANFMAQPSDSAFDFEVYAAEDVSPVYHLKVRRLDGTWEFVISYNFNAAMGTSSPGSKLAWDSYHGARRYGLSMKRKNEATDFVVVEHWPQPSWSLIATVDTFEEAAFLADIIESNFGMMTEIDSIQVGFWMNRP